MTATEAKWAERVRRWKASGQSADEYSVALGVRPSTLRWWSSRVKHVEALAEGNAEAAIPATGVRMVRVVARRKQVEGSLRLRIGAAQVEVRAGFDRALLRELVEALGEPS